MAVAPGEKLPLRSWHPLAGSACASYCARGLRDWGDVAIKMSAARYSDRFEPEARAVAALSHPNTCALYDVGPDELVMEYIKEESP